MSTSPTEPDLVNSPQGPDPLAKLHKMSTTAGVASQQYVAVNTSAVIAALLGVASALALLPASYFPDLAFNVCLRSAMPLSRSFGSSQKW